MKKKEIAKELEGVSPFLFDLKKDKKEDFSMPTNYFNRFEDRLMHRIKAEAILEKVTDYKSATPTLSSFSFWTFLRTFMQLKYAIGFSTSVLLIVLGLYVVNNGTNPPSGDTNIEGLLAEADIDDYINNNIEEFTIDEILTVLVSEEIEIIEKKIAPIEELSVESSVIDNSIEKQASSMDKALETIENDDFLDDLTIDDLEKEDDDLF